MGKNDRKVASGKGRRNKLTSSSRGLLENHLVLKKLSSLIIVSAKIKGKGLKSDST